ncbi:uncharacterized protein LOC108475841 [Gossypium arboreum]|uniref:Uncharacterized protein n=1 Tax=Gossypium arboreum TaxID=29729 RepID=A0ABR0QMZ5_GOSAR|nr:uncharacterized protein LOC108475841 [Gossypium arboreum]KAK5840599.1 hypothetical protein PVK06_009502 [Gossypium arboreum]
MKSMIYLITKAKWKKSSKRKEKRFRERMRAEMGMIRVRQQTRSKTAARMQCSSIVAEMERLQEEVALKREETSALRQQQLREETMAEAILQNLNQQRLLNACFLLQHSCNQHLLDLLIPHFLG